MQATHPWVRPGRGLRSHPMPTRVLHLIKGLGPGGAEQLLVNQARATDSNDLRFEVAYLVPRKNHHAPTLEEMGWTTHCLNSGRPADLRWLPRLRTLVQDRDIGVVHGHSPLVSALARMVVRSLPAARRPRMVYTEHNEWGRHNRLTRTLNRITIGREDHVIAVSDAVRQSMRCSSPIEVLEHGIDVEAVALQQRHRADVRAELGLTPDEYVIGTVANLRKEKAYDVLLRAAAIVIEACPEARFVSVGQGPLESSIRELHEELRLGDRFLLLGYRADAVRVMSGFDAFTLASRHEGLPVALMEAMALGLPVVSTSVGGIPSALHDWPATLVDPSDEEALAAALIRAVRDRVPRTQSSRAFDAAGAASRLSDIYCGAALEVRAGRPMDS